MSSRPSTYWQRLLARYRDLRPYSSATTPKMKPHGTPQYGAPKGTATGAFRFTKPEFFPIYTLLGMMVVVVTLGLHTGKQQLLHSPSVMVDKRMRKEIPEIKDPDHVLQNSEDFVNKSFVRRVLQSTGKGSDELRSAMPWRENQGDEH